MPELQSALEKIEALLRKYGHSQRADIVAEYQMRLQTNRKAAYRVLCFLEWWGGAGSMADFVLFRYSYMPDAKLPTDEEREEESTDNRNFRDALVEIADALESQGITTERMAQWKEVFRDWKRMGIYHTSLLHR